MQPQARREGVRIEVEGEEFLLWEGERAHRVHPLTALVWKAADGTRTVPELAACVQEQLGMAVETQTVWSALDVLADAGLLVSRVTPPGGVSRFSRRDLLRHAGVTGLAATALGVTLPGLAAAQAAPEAPSNKAQEEKIKTQRQEKEPAREEKFKQAQPQQTAQTQEQEAKRSQEEKFKQQQQAQQNKEQETKRNEEQRQKQQQQQQQAQQSKEQEAKRGQEERQKQSRDQSTKATQAQQQQKAEEQKSREAQAKKGR